MEDKPTLWQRIWGRARKAAQRVVALVVPTWRHGQPTFTASTFPNLVRVGYKRNELIFSCIGKAATTGAMVSLEVRDTRTEKMIDDHPVRRLLKRPNEHFSENDLYKAIVIFLKLAGRAYFEIQRTVGGEPIALWPLRPDWVDVIHGADTPIARYEYRPHGMAPIPIAPENVLDFRLFDPMDLFRGGLAPTIVAARVGDVDNSVTEYIKLFFEKGGMPPGILTTTQILQDTDVERIRARWKERYGGYANWNEPAILDKNAKYDRVGLTFDEMGFDNLDARDEVRICMTMGVPPIIAGAKVGLDRSTYENYKTARTTWWEDEIVPQYQMIRQAIERKLLAHDESVELVWDFSGVPALQESADKLWTRAVDAFRAGGITVNVLLGLIGLDELGPSGDVFVRSMTTVEVPAKTVRVTTEPGDDEVINGKLADLRIEPRLAKAIEDLLRAEANEYKAMGVSPDDKQRRTLENRMNAVATRYLSGVMERVADATKSAE